MELPLFPLHTVLCPGVALPLRVFEPRYRALVQRCLVRHEPFGVVLIRAGREVGPSDLAVAGIGTLAEIREVRRSPSGRFDIVAIGTRRFGLDEVVVAPEGYLVGRATELPELVGDPDVAARLVRSVGRRLVAYLELLRPGGWPRAGVAERRRDSALEGATEATEEARRADAPASPLEIPREPIAFSYLVAGLLQVDHPTRQRLLETPAADARLAALDRLLEREIDLLGQGLLPHLPDPRLVGTNRN